jgi:V/A-type H+-transporting ATPase subunit E
MSSVDESLSALSRAVTQRVRADADQVLADAQARADDVREQARRQAEAEREKILGDAAGEAERIRSQAAASARLKGRTRVLERREKLLDEVFEAARQRLPSIQEWTNYDRIVYLLASEAIAQLRVERCHIRADDRTLDVLSCGVLEELKEGSKVQMQVGEALKGAIGVLAETPDGHRQYDNTLAARLERLEDELRFPVYRLLTGESL